MFCIRDMSNPTKPAVKWTMITGGVLTIGGPVLGVLGTVIGMMFSFNTLGGVWGGGSEGAFLGGCDVLGFDGDGNRDRGCGGDCFYGGFDPVVCHEGWRSAACGGGGQEMKKMMRDMV